LTTRPVHVHTMTTWWHARVHAGVRVAMHGHAAAHLQRHEAMVVEGVVHARGFQRPESHHARKNHDKQQGSQPNLQQGCAVFSVGVGTGAALQAAALIPRQWHSSQHPLALGPAAPHLEAKGSVRRPEGLPGPGGQPCVRVAHQRHIQREVQ